jgi:putative hemolysin
MLHHSPPAPSIQKTRYSVRFATTPSEIESAQRLRFEVFNLELDEGLAASYENGLDADPFDPVCEHVIVEDHSSRSIIGTYRLQTGLTAAANLGYYSAQEFDFSPYEKIRPQLIELGRACVHRDHRSISVISLMWRAIAQFTRERRACYLIGCTSLTSQDPKEAAAVFDKLSAHALVAPHWQTTPLPEYLCPLERPSDSTTPVPRLLQAYLRLGAKICGPPALDRLFKTVDFLTFLDLNDLAPNANRFL